MSELLTPEEAAKIMGRAVTTLQSMRSNGGGPKFIKVGHRTVRYKREDIMAWLEQRTFNNTTEEAQKRGRV